MRKFYVEHAGSNKLLAVLVRFTFRLWWRCFAIVFLLCCTMQYANSQIVTEGAEVKANFGIDADVYTNYIMKQPDIYVNPIGTDDWFEKVLYGGSGTPVFAPDSAFIADIISVLSSNNNKSFVIRMSDFGHIPRNFGPDANGITWIDGVYARDNNSAQGDKDSTAFAGTSDKNFQDPSTWNTGIKDPYQKGDLIEVMGHMRIDDNIDDNGDGDPDVWGIGAFSTRSSTGVVHADFEFFANQVGFDGSHFSNTGTDHGHTSWTFDSLGVVQTAGDLIVSIDYEKGGDLPVASIRVWVSEADYLNGFATWGNSASFNFTNDFTTESGIGFGYAEIQPADGALTPAAWAVVNIDSVTPAPPWGTQEGEKADVDSVFAAYQFAEFAINLSYLGLDAFGGDACNKKLGSLLVKSRSSPSFESEMHDFVGPLLFGFDLETKIVAMDLDSCDDGVNQFDLETAVDSTGEGVVTFYASSADASANPPVNAISSIQTLPVGDTMFWARSSNSEDQGCFAVDSFTVTVHENPSCTVYTMDESYFNAGNGSAWVVVTGGSPDYEYQWSTPNGTIGSGEGTDSIYGLSDGTYEVYITDQYGCATSCKDSLRWAPTAPTCAVFTVDVECYGAETGIVWAEVTPSDTIGYPPYTYYWFKDGGKTAFDTTITNNLSDTMYNMGAGIYDVEVYNAVDPNGSFCGDTIFQPDPNPVNVECSNLTVDACLGQDSINTAFGNWLDTVFMVSGGTDPLDTVYKISGVEVDIDTVSAPDFCGDSKTIQMIVSDYCGLADTCDATFTVSAPAMVWLTAPADTTVEACADSAAIQTAYENWLEGVMSGGGCGLDVSDDAPTLAPDACGDSVVVIWTAMSDCEAPVMDTATFTVTAPAMVWLTAPADTTVEACADSAAIQTAYENWLEGVMSGGGCGLDVNDDSPTLAPDACGDSVVVIWTATSDCEAPVMDTATFKVSAPAMVWLTAPADTTVEACADSAAIQTAYENWLDGVMSGGGCGLDVSDDAPTLAPDACGAYVEVIWTAISDCEAPVMDTATFTVTDAPAVVYTTLSDTTVSACLSQAEVEAAYALWSGKLSFSEGCDLSENTVIPSAPDACGDSATVTWNTTSSCEAAIMGSATFIVLPDTIAPVITINIVQDSTCNSDPEATATFVDDCLGQGDASLQSLNKVAVDPSDPNKCDEYWIYTFYAEDSCGNSATATDTLFRFTESEGDCETAFARLADDLSPAPSYLPIPIGARCFLDEPDTAIFNRWGWTNRVLVDQDSVYTLDVYAGAGQCDLSKGTWVGTVTLTFSGSTMNVVYDLEDGYVISEAHIYAGTNMYPTWKNGKHKDEYTVAPGQYTVVWENAPPATGLEVDLIGVSDGDYIFVIVHSVVCIPTCDCPETVRTEILLASQSIITQRGGGKKNVDITTDVIDVVEGELRVYPNPFTDKVTFEFVSATDAYGTLDIYSLTGQRIARILDRQVMAGELNKVFYKPDHDVSGVYLYRLDLDGNVQVGRIIYKE